MREPRYEAPHVAPAVLTMHWRQQTMVHWRYPPEAVQALLPPGLFADVFDEAAWVSLTPLVMRSVRVLRAPLPPPDFPETNLRTYARLPDGRRGLWFFSLDVVNPLMLAARAVGIPYHVAALSVESRGHEVGYSGRRRLGDASYRLRVRGGARVVEPDPLDDWLTHRWAAFSRRAGRLWLTPVEHEPWPLYRGTILELSQTLTRSAKLPDPGSEPLVHTSPGVGPVRMGLPRPVG
ncbi:YqjF family protein [Streptomyces sp. NPDC088762]|uniref:YqjF family protein n=1 Tax=Streptomyces sp. NPDC088762 TaxID=3365891 RepID=UPI0038047EE3